MRAQLSRVMALTAFIVALSGCTPEAEVKYAEAARLRADTPERITALTNQQAQAVEAQAAQLASDRLYASLNAQVEQAQARADKAEQKLAEYMRRDNGAWVWLSIAGMVAVGATLTALGLFLLLRKSVERTDALMIELRKVEAIAAGRGALLSTAPVRAALGAVGKTALVVRGEHGG